MTESDIDCIRVYCTSAIKDLLEQQACDHEQFPTISINVEYRKHSKMLIFTSYLDKTCDKCEDKDSLVAAFEIK